MGKIILVTGGARSGKSAYAEELVERIGHRIAYIATAQAFDEEMRHRILLHQARRPASWQTLEAPFHAEKAIERAAEQADTILFDCLTVYLSNMLCNKTEEQLQDEEACYQEMEELVQLLIEAVRSSEATAVFVTNEVGAGIVPENHLARLYRDLAGLANQRAAAYASEVYAVLCGIPVRIK